MNIIELLVLLVLLVGICVQLSVKNYIRKGVNRMAKTQAELAEDLRQVKVRLDKIAVESAANVQAVKDLQEALANQVSPSQELQDAVAAVVDQTAVVDDLVPDAPVP